MFPTHGYWCNTRTFPTVCRYCGNSVFYHQCDCGSKVFFNSLGSPWPVHNCQNLAGASPTKPRPSGKTAWTKTLKGVSFSTQAPDHGLLPGMTVFNGSIADEVVRRVRSMDSTTRETMAISPFYGLEERILGVVSDIRQFSLDRKFDIGPSTLGAKLIEERLGSMNVTQLTILVDEIDVDPDAIDRMSYAVWCSGRVAESLDKGSVVSAAVEAENILGIGYRWIANSLEPLA